MQRGLRWLLNGFGGHAHGDGLNRGLGLHMLKAAGNIAQPFNMRSKVLRVAFEIAVTDDSVTISKAGKPAHFGNDKSPFHLRQVAATLGVVN